MRTTPAILTTAFLLTGLASAQTDKTFYFTQAMTVDDMTAVTTMIRTVVDLQDIVPDEEHHALKARGPLDKLVAADWIFQQVDRPAATGATPEYKMTGKHEEVMRMFRISPAATNAQLTAIVTAIRTVADLQRLFPYQKLNAIVGRGEPEKMALADWMVGQLSPFDGDAPTADSPVVPSPLRDPKGVPLGDVVQVLRIDPKTTTAELTGAVTAIRTVADIQRLFPYQGGQAGQAIICAAAPEKIAVAAWLVGELSKPADIGGVHQTAMPGVLDGMVRLFDTGANTSADLASLAAEIRETLGIQRLFPLAGRSAIVVRGRPDQISSADALVAQFVAHHSGR